MELEEALQLTEDFEFVEEEKSIQSYEELERALRSHKGEYILVERTHRGYAGGVSPGLYPTEKADIRIGVAHEPYEIDLSNLSKYPEKEKEILLTSLIPPYLNPNSKDLIALTEDRQLIDTFLGWRLTGIPIYISRNEMGNLGKRLVHKHLLSERDTQDRTSIFHFLSKEFQDGLCIYAGDANVLERLNYEGYLEKDEFWKKLCKLGREPPKSFRAVWDSYTRKEKERVAHKLLELAKNLEDAELEGEGKPSVNLIKSVNRWLEEARRYNLRESDLILKTEVPGQYVNVGELVSSLEERFGEL